MDAIDGFHIGFIGFGEAGQRFARDLIRKPGVRIKCYDILFGGGRQGAELLARANALGVIPCSSAAEACSGAHVIISAVTADAAGEVAALAATFVSTGQIFFDINSASPETKQQAAECFARSGASYVEAAVMAAVLVPGIQVPILAGGPDAEHAAAILNKLGMNVTAVAADYGKASAIKLCRSIMIKGLEALITDCAAASRAWDVSKEVYASLGATFPSIEWHALAESMIERVERHGVRRAAEMREAADMLCAIGINPSLGLAVADAQQRGAAQPDEAARAEGEARV